MTAPITPTEFWKFPGLPKNTEMTTSDVQLLLDKAWETIECWCNQPLSLTTENSELIQHGTIYCNTHHSVITILPRFFPLVSVTSVQYAHRISGEYQLLTGYRVLGNKIMVDDSPFITGEKGYLEIAYTHGFSTIPGDLIAALCFVTDHMLSAGYFPTSGGVAEGSLTPAWLPKDVEQTISRYRRNR